MNTPLPVIAEGMTPPQRILFPPEEICMDWQQRQRPGPGLRNLGSTCYINVILQCLTYTPPLANYLLSCEHSQLCFQQGFCMMCIMEAHVRKVLRSSASAIWPKAVIRDLKLIGEEFEPDTAGDAFEFLCCALKAMQRACLGGSSKCEKKVTISKRVTVHHVPKVFTVCLERAADHTGKKISTFVEYPEYLDLLPYMSDTAAEPLLYSLYAVVVHSGDTCLDGHFFCYTKASNGLWYKMDDESVDNCGIHAVLRQQAYLLFYARAKGMLSKFPENTKLAGVTLRPGGRADMMRDVGRLERWVDRDPLGFSKGKCKGFCAGAEHQWKLHRKPVEAPSLDMFHSPLCMVMDKWLQVPMLKKQG
ncbi:ubiquitin carboxyl-terminal hydrolase 42-like protein [Pitangus sulphuratus]|nr:ubiquitin carboxyl-terminal hydrolase 42-like protein [Pitangus sulphuratus]